MLGKKQTKENAMPAKIYKVSLSTEEREWLQERVSQGKQAARTLTHARILLLADANQADGAWVDRQIAAALGTSSRTVERVRQSCVECGIEAALHHKAPRRTREKILDGAAEARLVQIACTEAPGGRQRWTMQLLADELMALEIVETVSDETVRTTLKKTNLNRG
jgi:transposase